MSSTNWARVSLLALIACASSCGGGGSSSAPPPTPPADTTPPDTTLTITPAALSNQNSASFTATATEAGSTFEVSLDNAAYAQATSPFSLSALADGAHTFNVRARDAAGNVDPTPATFTWTVDATAPSVQIQFPGAQGYTHGANVTVRGTAQDSGTINALTVAGIPATATTANYATWSAQVPLAVGENVIAVSTSDAAGNSRASVASTRVTRGGPNFGLVSGLAIDAPRNRLLVADVTNAAIFALPTSGTGIAEVVSDATHGTGPALANSSHFDLFGNDSVAYVQLSQADTVLSVNLLNGNRASISPPSQPLETRLGYAGLACNLPCNTLYAMTGTSQSLFDAVLFSIDVATGVRTQISGGALGTGPQFRFPGALTYDTSGVTAYPRVFLTDSVDRAIYQINLLTGERALFSQAGQRGNGLALLSISKMRVDTANGELIVVDCDRSGTSSGCFSRLLTVNLVTGDRTQIAASTASVSLAGTSNLAMDSTPGQVRLYMESDDGTRIARLDYSSPTRPLTPYYDVAVGSGARLGYSSSVAIQDAGPSRSLLLSATLPTPRIVRVDPVTGNRTLLSAAGSAGNGNPFFTPRIISLDSRTGAPTNRLLVLDQGGLSASLVVSVDLTSGDRAVQMPAAIPYGTYQNFILDAPGNQVLAGVLDSYVYNSRLEGFNLDTGASTLISGPGRGSGPTLEFISGIGIDERAGAPRRFLVVDGPNRLIAIDPATGNRSTLSSNDAAFTGPQISNVDKVITDPTRQRAYLVNRIDGAILSVDLANGNRTLLSGVIPATAQSRGTGPAFANGGGSTGVAFDSASGVLFMISAGTALLAIDLVSGDRVLISR